MDSKTYTKIDVAKMISKNHDISVSKSLKLTNDFFSIIRNYLIEDNKYTRIEIRNFGVFESKPAKAKPKARNPRTNEEIYVPAHKKTRFKASKLIKTHLKKPI